MTPNPNTMTAAECADWCAKDDGWNYEPPQTDGLGHQPEYWWKYTISPEHGGRTYSYKHPFPLTLDGAARAMPEGWNIQIESCETADGRTQWDARAWRREPGDYTVACKNDTRLEAEYRLAVACRLAEKEERNAV